MIRPWNDIEEHYAGLVAQGWPLDAMLQLVQQIKDSRYANGIFAWTSMADLAISQSASVSHSHPEPYLRISSLQNGKMDFVYIDTHVDAKIWRRIVDEDASFSRLERFFDQLHWFSQTRSEL